jgi:hypothetical protein
MNGEGIGARPAMAGSFHSLAGNLEVSGTNPDFYLINNGVGASHLT